MSFIPWKNEVKRTHLLQKQQKIVVNYVITSQIVLRQLLTLSIPANTTIRAPMMCKLAPHNARIFVFKLKLKLLITLINSMVNKHEAAWVRAYIIGARRAFSLSLFSSSTLMYICNWCWQCFPWLTANKWIRDSASARVNTTFT